MKKATFHVTDLDQLVWFRKLESMETSELVSRLRRESAPNDKMLMGTAFHSILEDPPDVIDVVEKDGFTFKVECDAEIALPQVREIRATKTYLINGVLVTLTGGCDGITGNKVSDHKLTFNPKPENYFDSFQWKAYLDIFQADVFNYLLYHGKEGKGKEIMIRDVSTLTLYRYPSMVADLEAGIRDLVEFALEYLPEKIKENN